MKEPQIMEKYKKHQLLKDFWLWILAFAIWFWISHYYQTWNINTDFLKADLNNSIKIEGKSIVKKENSKEKKDISLEKIDDNNIVLNFNKKIENPTNISFTLVYEKDKLNIKKITSLGKNLKIVTFETKPWFLVVSLTPLEKNKNIFWKIINLEIEKKFNLGDNISFINISSANYEKNKKFYPITVSWINVF